jgi:hypothetical protein
MTTIYENQNEIQFIKMNSNLLVINKTKDKQFIVFNCTIPENYFEYETILLLAGNTLQIYEV